MIENNKILYLIHINVQDFHNQKEFDRYQYWGQSTKRKK